MTAKRPTFRVMKNGYDRFAVDDAVERYAAQVDALQRKIELYQEQLVETTRELNTIKEQLAEMEKNEAVRKEASDRIARLSIREANEIIATAQANADEIIREALGTARLVLTDLTKLYKSAGSVKGQMNTQLEDLLKQLDSFKLPEMPDLRWLNEAENKLR
jgi:DivIVA protein.